MSLKLTFQQLQLIKSIIAPYEERGVQFKVFGSYAQNKATSTSDLDLLVMAEPPLTFAARTQLKDAFEYSNLPFKVDVVEWQRLDDNFKALIAPHLVELSAVVA